METRQPDSPADGIDIVQASMILGMSPDGVRKRLKKKTLEGYKDNNKWFVYLPDSTQTEQTRPDNHVDKQTDSSDTIVSALEARIGSMETQLAVYAEAAVRKDTQIGELHRLLAQTALSAAPVDSQQTAIKPWWRFWG